MHKLFKPNAYYFIRGKDLDVAWRLGQGVHEVVDGMETPIGKKIFRVVIEAIAALPGN